MDTINIFGTSYGELVFNDRFECIDFQGRPEHKEAALKEWFEHLNVKLKYKPATTTCPECGYIARACLGCGRPDC